MRKDGSHISNRILVLCLISLTWLIQSVTPATSAEPTYKKGERKLTTTEGHQFWYGYFPAEQKGPTAVYIAGLHGVVTGGYSLAQPLNKQGFNFVGFNRIGETSYISQRDSISALTKRSRSGNLMWPSVDGRESSTQDIVSKEISLIIEFLEKSPTHDPNQGIYLIGGSYGAWLSIVTANTFLDKIRGIVFVTPAILPNMIDPNQAQNPHMNISNYFRSMVRGYGERPALAIGSKTDIINNNKPEDGSAFDSAMLLKREMGDNVEVMEVPTSVHEQYLLAGSDEVKRKVIEWLKKQAAK
jgi:pimeloyl-ACP methyl ester carboxylesterase